MLYPGRRSKAKRTKESQRAAEAYVLRQKPKAPVPPSQPEPPRPPAVAPKPPRKPGVEAVNKLMNGSLSQEQFDQVMAYYESLGMKVTPPKNLEIKAVKPPRPTSSYSGPIHRTMTGSRPYTPDHSVFSPRQKSYMTANEMAEILRPFLKQPEKATMIAFMIIERIR